MQLKSKIIVAFMGVDGSGKTTLAKKINKLFKESKYLHLKPYILIRDRRTTVKDPHFYNKSSFIISFIRIISWLISYKIFFFINKSKGIYIFDRYAHDVIVDPVRYKNSLSKNIIKFIIDFFPKPNLWIFLNTSIKVVKSRKNELNDKELKRQIKEYSIFFKNKKNVLRLNTNTLINISTLKIKNKIKTFVK